MSLTTYAGFFSPAALSMAEVAVFTDCRTGSRPSQAPVSIPTVFVGAIGGISAFGLIGVIIGPVLLTAIAALPRFLDETLSVRP